MYMLSEDLNIIGFLVTDLVLERIIHQITN